MRDGLPRVRQHLVPVVPAQAFRVDPHTADSYDLIVAHSEGETKGPAWGPGAPSERVGGGWDSVGRSNSER